MRRPAHMSSRLTAGRRRCVAVSSPCAVVPTAHLCKHACSRHGVGSGRVSTRPPEGENNGPADWACRGMATPRHLCKHAICRHDAFSGHFCPPDLTSAARCLPAPLMFARYRAGVLLRSGYREELHGKSFAPLHTRKLYENGARRPVAGNVGRMAMPTRL